jgi:hypothetical protein
MKGNQETSVTCQTNWKIASVALSLIAWQIIQILAVIPIMLSREMEELIRAWTAKPSKNYLFQNRLKPKAR